MDEPLLMDEPRLLDKPPLIEGQSHEHCLPDFGGHEHLS